MTLQLRPVEVSAPIYRGVPWRPVELRFRDGPKPLNLTGYDIVAELRATDSRDSALVAVLEVDRADNEGLVQPFLTAVQTDGLAEAAVGGYVMVLISGPETDYQYERVAFGEIPVLEVAAP